MNLLFIDLNYFFIFHLYNGPLFVFPLQTKIKLMKKISFFTLLLLTGIWALCQDQPRLTTPMSTQLRFGIRGGVNLADLYAKDQPANNTMYASDSKMRTSFIGGLFANLPIGGDLRLQPEVDFSGQGGKLTYNNGNTYTYDQVMHYINVPVMLQLQTKGGFFVETGPQFSFLVGAKVKSDNTGSNGGTLTDNTDDKDGFDKFDFAWAAGVGYLSRVGLGIEARYNLGITNTIADNTTTSGLGGTWKNRVAQISLIYQFGAGK